MEYYVHGSLAFDRIMNFEGKFEDQIMPENIHKLSVSFFIPVLEEMHGGTAGNIAYNLMLLGDQAHIVSCVGGDFGPYMEYLQKTGIHTDEIQVYEYMKTAGAYMITDKKNNQITGFYPGALTQKTAVDISSQDSENTIHLFGPRDEVQETLDYAAACKKKGIPYIFDPGQTTPMFSGDQLREIIEGSYMFVSNDYEMELVKKATGATEQDIAQLTEVMVTTLGENGSTMYANGDTLSIPACSTPEVVDPTGAGDAYRAGLLKGFALGLPLEQTGRLGSCAATYAIEQYGTQEHSYTAEEFAQRYVENFGEDCPLVD